MGSRSFIGVPFDEHQYGEIRNGIGPDLPQELLVHLVVRRDHGLRYIDVWEAESDWERFRDERVMPSVRTVMAAQNMTPPTSPFPEEILEVVDITVGHQAA
jgi:hypothetical protein